jgi:glycosyltransferase involved in cell wall biosynthesis
VSAPALRATIVVPSHNRSGRLTELLDALGRQTLPAGSFELVVVDDASTDGTPALLDRAAGDGPLRLRSLRQDVNTGPAAARNAGWTIAAAPLVVFTDDDCVPTPGWLEALVAAAEQNPGAIVQGSVAPRPDEAHLISPLSRTLTIDRLGPWFQTANVAYPRELLERHGGFAPDLRTGEDADMAWRAIEAGTPTVWAPEALTHHAVQPLGVRGTLRVAWQWSDSVRAYRDHPGLRAEVFQKGIFWKGSHYLLVRALIGALVGRRAPRLGGWLARPYFSNVVARQWAREHGHPWHAPVMVARDVVETAAMVRGAVRYRFPAL